jgi:hypothetical protein
MKIRVTFKDPDGPSDCIEEAVKASVQEMGLADQDEAEAVYETRLEKVREKVRRWLECMEYITVEFDLEADTATVVKRGG